MCMTRAPKTFFSEQGLTQWHRDVTSWHMFPTIPGSLPPAGFRVVSSSVRVAGAQQHCLRHQLLPMALL